MGFVVSIIRWLGIALFSVLRVINVLEPSSQGTVPVRDYFPLLSWSKITRIVGVVLVVLMMAWGVTDWEIIMGLLTYAGGEASYRWRQWHQADTPGSDPNIDNPDSDNFEQ